MVARTVLTVSQLGGSKLKSTDLPDAFRGESACSSCVCVGFCMVQQLPPTMQMHAVRLLACIGVHWYVDLNGLCLHFSAL